MIQVVSIKVDPEDAVRIMREADCTPLVPYPGSAAPWPSIHEPCGREISPNYANVRKLVVLRIRKPSLTCPGCESLIAGVQRGGGR
jgi:predicted metalloenzyme YecM